MSFTQLLAELEAAQAESALLAKSIPKPDGEEGDKKIAKASGDDGDGDGDEDKDGDGDGDEGHLMTKSLVLDGGEEVTLVDAEAMLKSHSELADRVNGHEDLLVKCLAFMKDQNLLIKSLAAQSAEQKAEIQRLGSQGTGRKTVLDINEKQGVTAEGMLAKSQPDGLTPQAFLLKSNAAFDAKRITGRELTTIDVALRSGQLGVLDESLINRVLS
jgi:hypothetical protein